MQLSAGSGEQQTVCFDLSGLIDLDLIRAWVVTWRGAALSDFSSALWVMPSQLQALQA